MVNPVHLNRVTTSSKDFTPVRQQLKEMAGRVQAVATQVIAEDEVSVTSNSSVSSTSSSDSDGGLSGGTVSSCVVQ